MSRPIERAGQAPFVHRRRILFGETDAARIVYTAEFPRLAMEAIEVFLDERLGVHWYSDVVDGRWGTPAVHLSFDIRHPLSPRHPVEIGVLLVAAGRSSLTLRLEGHSNGRLSFEAKFVFVFVEPGHGHSIPIPDAVRPAVEAELALATGLAGAADA